MIKAYPTPTTRSLPITGITPGQPYFVVLLQGRRLHSTTAKEVGRVFGIAKFTPGVNAIRDWCKEVSGEQPAEPEA